MRTTTQQKPHKLWHMVFIYSAVHFVVDFACAFLMFRSISHGSDWYLCLLLYNFCAFALQMPLGILADKFNRNFLIAAFGCALVAAAYGLWQVSVLAAVTLGVGNAMFHIGGGIDVLNMSEEKSGALGVFVSPGAFGIYFGTMLGKSDGFPALFCVPALFLSAGLIFALRFICGTAYPQNAEFSIRGANPPKIFAAILCLFLVVCLRSYVGLASTFPWKNSGYWGILLVCAVVFGKIAGGFFADRFGATKTSLFSLGFCALLFCFWQIPLAGIAAVLLFNMTMPITLWAMAKIFPQAKGFSFGLLTFALFLGFLPVHFGAGMSMLLVPGLAIVSMVLLWAGLKAEKI